MMIEMRSSSAIFWEEGMVLADVLLRKRADCFDLIEQHPNYSVWTLESTSSGGVDA